MKFIKFLFVGVIFGITMAKAEIISWYRIFEMFHFDSFHMYGVIGSAVILGTMIVQVIKRGQLKAIDGEQIILSPKAQSISRYLIGGIFFGLGWVLTGACPGSMFILIGYGYWSIFILVIGAILGTLFYGVFRNKLPH